MATRWGILGGSKIANDFIVALKTLPNSEHEVVAIAARSFERANAMAKLHGVSSAYGSYEELVNNLRVEIVYVATIHPQHSFLTKLALNNGKHVLCEKPMTMNSREANEVLDLAKEKGLFFMEVRGITNHMALMHVLRDIHTELRAGGRGGESQSHAFQCSLTLSHSHKYQGLEGYSRDPGFD